MVVVPALEDLLQVQVARLQVQVAPHLVQAGQSGGHVLDGPVGELADMRPEVLLPV